MSHKGQAYVMATAIYAGNKAEVDTEDVAYRIYTATTINPSFSSDDVRADVYAQLAEKLTADTKFVDAVDIIEEALRNTEHALRTHG